MCGICGFITHRRDVDGPSLASAATGMANALAHRGPDDSGVWTDAETGVALGHRRLSIIDLSALGHQPMQSASGRYWVVLNGEIYNFPELRAELSAKGHGFRGTSDTEVLLACIEEWGVRRAVERLVGMFAFAIWDRRDRRLHLVRDRVGEKPLYYGWVGEVFMFGSELKSLCAHPAWSGQVDRDALAAYLRFSYVPAPYSIYKGIRKLVPGTILTLELDRDRQLPEPVPYWSAESAVASAMATPFTGTEDEAADELHRVLSQSVRQQMVADVPLGAFLSGGVDSSTIVALMQSLSDRPVRTFTIGFSEAAFNEAEHAKLVARHLGTDHTELYVTPADAMEVIPSLSEMYDEPFADSSQIPTHLVSRLARKHVTVALSGDGGDELFGGYNRYRLGARIWRGAERVPRPLRSALARLLTSVSPAAWDRLIDRLRPALPAGVTQMRLGEKMGKLANVLRSRDGDAVYDALVSVWPTKSGIAIGASELPTAMQASAPAFSTFVARMMYLDLLTYLPDDILAKVDRAAMSVSLETRIPFLDHRVIEFAWRVPNDIHMNGGAGKQLLRKILYRYVPASLIERPKMGFAIPVGQWMRAPLRAWAADLLDETRLRQEGFLDARLVRDLWARHLSGAVDGHFPLWSVLMFQAWLRSQGSRRSRP